MIKTVLEMPWRIRAKHCMVLKYRTLLMHDLLQIQKHALFWARETASKRERASPPCP
jgi:hypothetical protein